MIQTIFTRKNYISISLAGFYSLILLFAGLCLDAGTTLLNAKNPLAMMSEAMGFAPIESGTAGFICLALVAFYVIVGTVAVIYERRYAVVNQRNPHSPKMFGIYALSILICLILSIGIGILFQDPINWENTKTLLLYISQCVVVSTVIYAVLLLIGGAALMFVINFLFVDKPFKFFNNNEEPIFDDEDVDTDVQSSFESSENTEGGVGTAGGIGGAGGIGFGDGNGEATVKSKEEIGDAERVFPTLSRIDEEYDGYEIESVESDDITLSELSERFRNYLASSEKLYFDIDTIRFFISGFGASKFQILEGLSGTGKSSLPRYFAKFVNGQVLFMPVQATWRDKSNILGFFNEFSSTYTETEFLVELYRANYNPDTINIFVLDEMNISRVEYYFADLLSVLEYPEDERRLKIMQLPYGFIPPLKLEDGFVKIPPNSHFVGTANKDDSTFTIADKVYDRAITTEFDNRNEPFIPEEAQSTINLSYSKLRSLYEDAINNEAGRMNEADIAKLNTITSYIYDQFGIAIGNRILMQVEKLVPIFVASGGTKERAIDFMLSKKAICKIEGRFEDYVKDALNGLISLIHQTYGQNVLKLSEHTAKNIIRTL